MHIRRRFAALAASTVTIGLLGAVPAVADHVQPRPLDPACADAPEDGLTDTGQDGEEQETAVDCLAWYEVTKGRTATTYEPQGDVTRGEMAAFLARVMRSSDAPLAEPGPAEDYFVDDNGGLFEDDINFVAKHDVADGTSETTFEPNANVTRAQMAKFLVSMLTAVGAEVPEATQDYFTDDDGGQFEAFINQVAELGIAAGTSETTFEPNADVTRGQMARFVARSMAELADQELLQTPTEGEPVTTDAPELVGSSDVTYHENASCTDAEDEADATHVQLVVDFDEAITGRDVPSAASGFRLVGFDATATEATAARLSATDDSKVEVCFPADAHTTATTLTVTRNTVGDVGNLGNPEGAIELKAVSLAGTTAPEVVSITPVSATSVRFSFDEAIASTSASGYRLVAADGSVIASTGATASGDDVTATFPDFSDETITRVAALSGAATGADGGANAVSVLDVAAGGLTSAPDLASVVYDPEATRVRDTEAGEDQTVQVDELRFVFDVSVLEQDDNIDDFVLVTADGSTLTPTVNQALAESTEDPVVRSGADARVVIVEFEDGALQTTTGAAVLDSAVRAAGGSQPVNRVDALARSPQLTYAAGTTLAPSPVEATISSSNALIGTSYTVTLTFDEPVSETFSPQTVSLYDELGRRYTISGTPARDADDPTVVTVTTGLVSGTNGEIAANAVLVGLAPDTVADDEGHGSHAQVVEL